MRIGNALLSLCFGLLLPVVSYANPINPDVTFYMYNATSNYGGVGSGSVTINTVTGTFVSEDITFSNVFLPEVGSAQNYIFSGLIPAGSQGPNFYGFGNSYGSVLSGYDFELPGTSLVGYTGGPICTVSNYSTQLCGGVISSFGTGNADENFANQLSGYLSPVSPTPEPSSLLLLVTGIVGVAGAVRVRLRRR